MEFGRLPSVDGVDFKLPADERPTTELLKQAKLKRSIPEVYIGGAKWGRTDWIGKLYPKGTKQADFLKHYVTHFNSIELNALFYQLFPVNTIEKWASVADGGFRFCPKFSNIITHIRRLKNAERETDAFLNTVSYFGAKLGPSFIQLGDNYTPKDIEAVKGYLESLPRDFDVALELRHHSWFDDKQVKEEMFGFMQEIGVSTVITDTAGRRDVLHSRLTTPKAFVRFVGNSLHPTDYKRIDEWVSRIDSWLNQGIGTIFFFIHQHDELYSPELSYYMIEKLNKQCGLQLKAPRLINNFQPPLF
ncbi:MAG TPA: DUF72 domain-containing protein [Chitinophagales bacterium]|nr:DUF72 domain-containing protein [Chitinophagales bacterium]